ncbi:methyltransferase domain-containing protein [candidate division KSB1 bacterium]|nr:methyltransferase domain-containing protein [candidate division KSB1 bacterium]
MNLGRRIRAYCENGRRIRASYDNPLKRSENLELKDRLEREFYDTEAEKYLRDFESDIFRYDPDEPMPLSHRFFYSRLERVKGKRILDIGCGYGFSSVNLAKRGARLDSIDISPKMIELTQKNAGFNQVQHLIQARLMSAQNLEFPDQTFDYVVGMGILHHLNLDLASKEISRVLKPGGKALFLEPRIPYKGLIHIRSLIPTRCYESPGGSQLTDRDIQGFAENFSILHMEYFLFLRKLTRFPGIKRFETTLDKMDVWLVNHFPVLSKLYWAIVLQLEK